MMSRGVPRFRTPAGGAPARAGLALAWTAALLIGLGAALTAAAGPSPSGGAAAERSEPGAEQEPQDSSSVVRAALRPAKLAARPGQAYAFEVAFDVAAGWHLYAHGDTIFYGIALTGLDQTPLAGARVAYPAGEPADFFGTPVRLLHGSQVVRVEGTLPPSAPAGARDVPLTLEVQACDDQRCLAPARIPLLLRLDTRRAGR